jgi:hypothetical protein
MEKGCILPNNLLKEITRPDNIVLSSLAKFCNCKQEDLVEVLSMRNDPGDKRMIYWYRKRRKQNGKKRRMISEPHEKLKKIQEVLQERLSFIPVSLSSTAGKSWDNAEKNADLHRYNPYLITLDIKDAYPSMETNRIFKYLKWSLLGKPLDIRCPLLENQDQQELFVRAITHLCVSDNQLPQWAPTSNQIQNIVLRWVDTGIERKLPELNASHVIYSRYADDITISFPYFTTKEVLNEKFHNYIKKLKELQNLEDLDQILNSFSQDSFILTDRHEHKYLNSRIEEIKKIIEDTNIPNDRREKYISIINNYKKQIRFSGWRIVDVSDNIIDILKDNWLKVNFKKTKHWTPQSNTDREINGLTFDINWNRWIDKKTRSRYIRLLNDLATFDLYELSSNAYYRVNLNTSRDNELIIETIINKILWIKSRINRIYGEERFPKELNSMIQQALDKWNNYPEREKKKIEWEREKQIEQEAKDQIKMEEKEREEEYERRKTWDDDLPF